MEHELVNENMDPEEVEMVSSVLPISLLLITKHHLIMR